MNQMNDDPGVPGSWKLYSLPSDATQCPGNGKFSVAGCASASTMTYTYTLAEMLDSLFSIRFRLGNGITVTDPFAVGIRNGMRTASLFGTLVPGQNITGQVSEPGTLALLGIGLMAAFIRKR